MVKVIVPDSHIGENEMNNEQQVFLSLRTIPARLEARQAAWYLGFAPNEIPIIVAAGLLKPLGHPAANGAKHFATATLNELLNDPQWLARASDAPTRYWQVKNGRRSKLDNGNISKPKSLLQPLENQPKSNPVVENATQAPPVPGV
jgi:hypothetical protein